MAVELTVPALGESITEAVVGKWHKKVGDAVAVDEPVVVLETDKVTIDVPAPAAGTLAAIAHAEGDTVKIGDVLGSIAPPGLGAAGAPAAQAGPPPATPPALPLSASGRGSARAPRRSRGAGRALARCRPPGADDPGGPGHRRCERARPGHAARERRRRAGDEGRRAHRARGRPRAAAAAPRPPSLRRRRARSGPARPARARSG